MRLVVRTDCYCNSEGSPTRDMKPTVIVVESDTFIRLASISEQTGVV
jgi:hypothetical protein